MSLRAPCSEGLTTPGLQRREFGKRLQHMGGTGAPFKALLRFFSPILLFFARHDVKWRPCISTLRSIDIMTQVCYEGTYFGAQHILHPANKSSWAWHTLAAMLAIWDYPKSWAHLATLPFPKLGELGDAQNIC